MKQKLTLYSMVTIIIETMCMFIPYCLKKERWKFITYHGVRQLDSTDSVNLFGVSTNLGKCFAADSGLADGSVICSAIS